MTDRVKNLLLIVLSITALALGGSALAGAASGGSGSSNNGSGNNSAPARPQFGGPGQAGCRPSVRTRRSSPVTQKRRSARPRLRR